MSERFDYQLEALALGELSPQREAELRAALGEQVEQRLQSLLRSSD